MGMLADDASVAEMKRLIGIVDNFNKGIYGQNSPYEVCGLSADKDGTLTVKLRPKDTQKTMTATRPGAYAGHP